MRDKRGRGVRERGLRGRRLRQSEGRGVRERGEREGEREG